LTHINLAVLRQINSKWLLDHLLTYIYKVFQIFLSICFSAPSPSLFEILNLNLERRKFIQANLPRVFPILTEKKKTELLKAVIHSLKIGNLGGIAGMPFLLLSLSSEDSLCPTKLPSIREVNPKSSNDKISDLLILYTSWE
jgi:hypothetical protein